MPRSFLRNAVFVLMMFCGPILAQSNAAPVIENAKIIPSSDDASKFIALFKMVNNGRADALVGVSSKMAGNVSIFSADATGTLPVPAGDSPALSLDGAYIVLQEIEGEMVAGRKVPLVLNFSEAGELMVDAVVQSPKKAMDHSKGDHAEMDHSKMDHATMDHATMDHSKMNHATSEPAPGVSIRVTQSAGSNGWDVHADVTNFEFSKDQVDGPHVPGIGHGHLYVDGIKIKRFYGRKTGFGALMPGKHIVRVTLNTNDHHAYSDEGEKVTASVEFVVH